MHRWAGPPSSQPRDSLRSGSFFLRLHMAQRARSLPQDDAMRYLMEVYTDERAQQQRLEEDVRQGLTAPPLALERLTESARGQVVFELPHPRADGATHLLLDPLELIEKLTLLIPPPRFHTLRFHGVLAPHAACRW